MTRPKLDPITQRELELAGMRARKGMSTIVTLLYAKEQHSQMVDNAPLHLPRPAWQRCSMHTRPTRLPHD